LRHRRKSEAGAATAEDRRERALRAQ